jgi:hypothetical protein
MESRYLGKITPLKVLLILGGIVFVGAMFYDYMYGPGDLTYEDRIMLDISNQMFKYAPHDQKTILVCSYMQKKGLVVLDVYSMHCYIDISVNGTEEQRMCWCNNLVNSTLQQGELVNGTNRTIAT